MNLLRRSPKLVASLTVTVVAAAAGVFFTQVDLGVGDQIASIGSFVVALVGLVISIFALRSGRDESTQGSRKGSVKIKKSGIVMLGDHSRGEIKNFTVK